MSSPTYLPIHRHVLISITSYSNFLSLQTVFGCLHNNAFFRSLLVLASASRRMPPVEPRSVYLPLRTSPRAWLFSPKYYCAALFQALGVSAPLLSAPLLSALLLDILVQVRSYSPNSQG
jgi:hypothetical protein